MLTLIKVYLLGDIMSNRLVKIFDGSMGSSSFVGEKPDEWKTIEVSSGTFCLFHKSVALEFNSALESRLHALIDGRVMTLGDFMDSHYIISANVKKRFEARKIEGWEIEDGLGSGKLYCISGCDGELEQKIEIKTYEAFPSVFFIKVSYINMGSDTVSIDRWINNQYMLSNIDEKKDDTLFWSYQSGSYEERPDWVVPLKVGFHQENYMGMNNSDYGGGTPVSDVWNNDIGLATGHVELIPKLVSIPVSLPDNRGAVVSVEGSVNENLEPGQSMHTMETFVMVHRGDFYPALKEYRNIMIKKGIHFEDISEQAYEPTWCAWGYERDFTMDMIYGALPMVKKLGIKWACLDDGWQSEEGDYTLNKEKFPNGDADMKRFVDVLHSEGLKFQLWWIPLAIDPKSQLIKEHPEYLLLSEDQRTCDITWFDSYYMCPASPEVREHTKQALKKMLIDWGVDGLKIDGQHLNAAPPCYNEKHNHSYPEESYEQMPEFFKMVYDLVREIKPEATVMFCPCGTGYSFFTMPYYNIPIASDPSSSWQIRTKGKAFKALMGQKAAFHGDHVELSDNENDFASTVGIGGVIDTKFTWPVGSAPVSILKPDTTYDLDQLKEQEWARWLDIYRSKALSRGEYKGELYTLGFDLPEGHAIKVGEKMYFSFFAETWKGEVELRGLDDKQYSVYDYIDDIFYPSVQGPTAKIYAEFSNHLLLEVSPV